MTEQNDFVGNIEVEVTETTWSILTLRITKGDLETYECANLREFRDKVRAGDVDIFDCDKKWSEPYDSSVEDCDYYEAKAILPDGIELED